MTFGLKWNSNTSNQFVSVIHLTFNSNSFWMHLENVKYDAEKPTQ